MKMGRSSSEIKTRLWASVSCAVLAATLFGLSACGALSSKERDETPSVLMLKAQEAYDKGKYDEAITHLNKVVENDPSNVLARARLAYSYLGDSGVSFVGIIKSKLPRAGEPKSSAENINSLTQSSGLPQDEIKKLQEDYDKGKIKDVSQLRSLYKQFQSFQKAFDTLCPLFPASTLVKLNTLKAEVKEAMRISACGPGTNNPDSNIVLAGIFLALAQVSSLQPVFLPTESDGKTFVLFTKAKTSSDKIAALDSDPSKALQNLQILNQNTAVLRQAVSMIEGDLVGLSLAQVSLLTALSAGSNLPDDLKNGIATLDSLLNSGLSKVQEFSSTAQRRADTNAGPNEVSKALTNAKSKAEGYFTTVTDSAEREKTCKSIYCAALTEPNPASFLPTQCLSKEYTCTQ